MFTTYDVTCKCKKHIVQLVVTVIVVQFVLLVCRLRQIQMSEYDGEMYEKYANAIRSQVKTLRVILDTLQVLILSILLCSVCWRCLCHSYLLFVSCY